MNRKALVISVIIALVIISAMLFFRGGRTGFNGSDSDGFIISSNAIYIAEQTPSLTIAVTLVRLEKSGFVVIHEDTADTPGRILGASDLLPVGETSNLAPIPLSRLTRNDETLYAMLHLDDGDRIFDEVKDKPALDPVGALPVMMIFTVNMEATEPDAVNL